jgi:hypothetical protein
MGVNMRRYSRVLLLATITAGVMVGAGCAEHHHYRVYDPYYTDYHQWNHDEEGYYREWARETHHDPNRDFRRLPPEDQKQYWTWRHNHGDRDHDRDHDHR